ncbi:sigma-54-dependent transcriptional regulator [candidate division CSSED10-310 bacterium]|uniref:Sigma-54-dependent transcriptional regulator n=1 Tax=candidate division CSSED10-310 bacterium TaxID=2855610 RepID=A0ABV6YU62_UNCC1
MKGKILVVEDQKNQRELIADYLKEKGHQVVMADDGAQAIELFQENSFQLVISDYKMKEVDGVSLLKAVKEVNPLVGVILISAFGTVQTAVQAMKIGAEDFLVKPINLQQLGALTQRALERYALKHENIELKKRLAERYRFDRIIGESGILQESLNLAARAAKSKATILIRGESGTGKALLANAIHMASDCAEGPFVEINCAALSPGVLESELFGHEKGAFTGADRRHSGRFEIANGGTLFIDEIGDIPLEVQVKLLNVLQSGTFMRVGGMKNIKTNVRIVAATHRNLEAMITEEKFREDLYFRLNVVSVIIPPIRDRRSDIPAMVDHFTDLYARKNQKVIQGLSTDALNCLMQYNYPGNVRELENAIMRAVVLARSTIMEMDDLPLTMKNYGAESAFELDVDLGSVPLSVMVETLEKKAITKALQETEGIQTKAAQILGLSERNLRYKMNKYAIKPKQDR